jgi:hypothetical protein
MGPRKRAIRPLTARLVSLNNRRVLESKGLFTYSQRSAYSVAQTQPTRWSSTMPTLCMRA